MRYYRILNVAITLLGFLSFEAAGSSDTYLPGYVITTNNDSLRGFILIQDNYFNSNDCVFKTSLEGNVTTYSANQLISYGTDDQKYYYYSFNVGLESEAVKKAFLECIVKGKSSLFYHLNRFFLKTPSKIIELTTKEHTVTKENKTYTTELPVYRGTLQNEMKDCQAIYGYLQTTKFERKSLTELFVKYNECVGAKFVVFKRNLKGGRVHFGFSLGVTASQLNFRTNGNLNGDYTYLVNNGPRSTNLTPSFWSEFSLANPRLRLRTGFTYYGANYQNSAMDGSSSKELTIKSQRLEIPIQAKYVINKHNTGMYFLAGAGVNASLQWDTLLVITPASGPGVSKKNLENNPIAINLIGGLGYEYQLGKRKYFAEADYGYIPDYSKSSIAECGISAFTFTAGIMF